MHESCGRQLGPGSLASACRHFPRVCLIDGRGTFVSLSHYCPTAAKLLLREDVPLEVVAQPPAFASGPHEGFDAREELPPLLRPGMLMDLPAYDRWERHVVDSLGREDVPLDETLLLDAIRTADLLLMHLVDGEALAQRLSDIEDLDTPAPERLVVSG